MIQAAITKVRNDSALLPTAWKGASVFVRVKGNTATITKVPSSKKAIFSKTEIKMLRELGNKMTKSTLAKAVRATR